VFAEKGVINSNKIIDTQFQQKLNNIKKIEK
jgi:hypothetical protein